ncbi:MAG: hypothetical protein FH756_18865 [Firmicutes bacterium]|nr:hypothetical protein [Bacillota bacterium]
MKINETIKRATKFDNPTNIRFQANFGFRPAFFTFGPSSDAFSLLALFLLILRKSESIADRIQVTIVVIPEILINVFQSLDIKESVNPKTTINIPKANGFNKFGPTLSIIFLHPNRYQDWLCFI